MLHRFLSFLFYSASKSHVTINGSGKDVLIAFMCRKVCQYLFKFNFLISYALGNAFVFAVCCCCVMRGFVFFFLCLLDKGIQNWRNIQSTDQINLKQSLFLFHVLFYDYGCHITSVELLSCFFLLSSLVHAMCRFLFSFLLVSQKSILFINANIISCIFYLSLLCSIFS